jgi:hypothetical protein
MSGDKQLMMRRCNLLLFLQLLHPHFASWLGTLVGGSTVVFVEYKSLFAIVLQSLACLLAFVVNFCGAFWIYIIVNIGIHKSTRGFIHGIRPVQVQKRRHLCWWCCWQQVKLWCMCESKRVREVVMPRWCICGFACGACESIVGLNSAPRQQDCCAHLSGYASDIPSTIVAYHAQTMHAVCFEHAFSVSRENDAWQNTFLWLASRISFWWPHSRFQLYQSI